MKKKVLILVAVAAMLGGYLAANTYAQHDVIQCADNGGGGGGGGGSSECNLCRIEDNFGKVIFSCKSTPEINKCSGINPAGYTLSCANATKCK
ncbi:MAG: hypothetical protein PHD00_03320 [Bacteroidales bacterium]|jgi:hypothetical protein|nr:hypothetical protein [Bacteroidales bacterium]MDD4671837.1 hypothetical protein [Bacteroidales bacterium]MDY0348842.1 hypothetical protein [Tenuifilaceae bacterium]